MVTVALHVMLNDEALYLDAVGFVGTFQAPRRSRRGYPIVTHQRISKDQNLTLVRGVGERFHVAGHTRVEHDLARNRLCGSERAAGQCGVVFEFKLHSAPRLTAALGSAARVVSTRTDVGTSEHDGSISAFLLGLV